MKTRARLHEVFARYPEAAVAWDRDVSDTLSEDLSLSIYVDTWEQWVAPWLGSTDPEVVRVREGWEQLITPEHPSIHVLGFRSEPEDNSGLRRSIGSAVFNITYSAVTGTWGNRDRRVA